MKIGIGCRVRTEWDDDVRFVNGFVTHKYRGHRGYVYKVRLDDGCLETVYAEQIAVL
jgi:hypothetical protein